MSAHEQAYAEVVCDPGEHAVGGGVASASGVPGAEDVNSSYPSDGTSTGAPGTTAWSVYVDNTTDDDLGFAVYVICAPATTVTGP